MHILQIVRRAAVIAVATAITLSAPPLLAAQSQEPKPSQAATPVAPPDEPMDVSSETGVSGATWEGPGWNVAVTWDPAAWSVQNEMIVAGYDGLQVGTLDSTVFIEAYEGFSGDAEACLADAVREIKEREGVSEVADLDGRPLPEAGTERGPASLLGILSATPEGPPMRGVEYVECRVLAPGSAVLELTWQTTAARFNDELPLVSDLFSAITWANGEGDRGLPVLPAAPSAVPNTAQSASRLAA